LKIRIIPRHNIVYNNNHYCMSLIIYIQTVNIEEIQKKIKNGKLKKEDIIMKDNNGRTALYWASYYGHLEIVKLLITLGNLQKKDIMMKDIFGETSLFIASWYGHLEIVKLLIIIGNLQKEDIMMNDNYNQTALYWESIRGHLEIVKLLITIGNLQKEDIMMKDNYGHSAYSVASSPIKQLFNNILFNGSINDMIKDIQQSTTLLCDIK